MKEAKSAVTQWKFLPFCNKFDKLLHQNVVISYSIFNHLSQLIDGMYFV